MEHDEESHLLEERVSRCMSARHMFSFMGFLGFVNIYAMRVNLSVAIVAMVNNTAIGDNVTYDNDTCPFGNTTHSKGSDGPFNWDEREQGLILGSFFYGYVVTQIPGGRLAEIWGGKWLYGVGVFITALFTILTPLAAHSSVGMLVAVRVIEGLAEGVTFPAMHAMLSKWSPPAERSKMAARVYSGSQLGTVISLPLSGYLADQLGWESVFYLFGVLGVLWCIAWAWIIADSPDTHRTISRQEREFINKSIGSAHSSEALSVPWRSIFCSLPVWALVLTHSAQNWGFYTLLTELPSYMKNILHFDIKENSFYSALPYLLMWITALTSSPIADYFIANGLLTRNATRKLWNSLAFCLPALFLVLAGYSGCDVHSTIAFLALAMGTNGLHYSGFLSTHLDMSPNFAGSLMGITNGISNSMGFLAPAFIGYIINGNEDLQHWRFIFFIAAVVYFAGNMVFVVFGSAKEQSWNHVEWPRTEDCVYQPISTSEPESD